MSGNWNTQVVLWGAAASLAPDSEKGVLGHPVVSSVSGLINGAPGTDVEATITPIGPKNALDVNISTPIIAVISGAPFDAGVPFPTTGFAAGYIFGTPLPFPNPVIAPGEMGPAWIYDGGLAPAGTETILGTMPRKPKTGGSVLFGTLADPVVAGFDNGAAGDVPARTFDVGGANVLGSVLRDPNPGDAGAFGLISTPIVVGFEDATTARTTARSYDTDSGAGTENTLGVNLRKAAAGGSVESGVLTSPLIVGFEGAGPIETTARTYDTDTGAGTENTLGVVLRSSASGGSLEITSTTIGPDQALDVNIVGSIVITVTPNDLYDAAFPAGGIGAGFAYGAPPFGGVDPGDMAPARVYGGNTNDLGYETILGIVPRKPKAGGAGADASVLFGTLADPVVAGFDNGAGSDVPARTFTVSAAQVLGSVLRDPDGTDAGAFGLIATPIVVGFQDAGGVRSTARSYDTDTGAGTENTLGINLRKAANGGSVESGILSSPLIVGFEGAGTIETTARTYDTDTGPGTENTLGVVLRTSNAGGSLEITSTTVGPSQALDVNIVGQPIVVTPYDQFDAAFPSGGIGAGFVYGSPPFGAVDLGDMAPARVYNGDTAAAGAETILGVMFRKPAAGGSVDFGTVADPIFSAITDTTNTAVVSAVAGGALQVDVKDAPHTYGAAFPPRGFAAGFFDGANMVAARTYDTDSGPGTENTLGIVLRTSSAGGSLEITSTTVGPSQALDVNIVGQPIIVTPSDQFDAAFPTTGVGAGFVYGTPPFSPVDVGDMAPAQVYDGDTGSAGAETILGITLRKPASGGSVELGTLTQPVFGAISDGVDGPVDVRNTTPVGTEFGLVVRPIGGGSGVYYDPFPPSGDGAGFLFDPVHPFNPAVQGDMVPGEAYDLDTRADEQELVVGVNIRGNDPDLPAGPSYGATIKTLGSRRALDVNIASGTITGADETRPATASWSSFAITAVPAQVLPINTARRGATFHNTSTSRTCYLLFQTAGPADVGLGPTKFSVEIAPGAFYELPFPVFGGFIGGVWSSGTPGGSLQVTELTP